MKSIRRPVGAALAAGVLAATAAMAAVPGEEVALAAAQEWAKAAIARDVDAQMKLVPKRLAPSPQALERLRAARLHEKEMALINGDRVLSFDVQPAAASGQVGKMTMIVFPYRSVAEVRGTKLQRESSLLAIAEEGEGGWSILDGSGQSTKSLRSVVPGYSGTPRIPLATSKVLKE